MNDPQEPGLSEAPITATDPGFRKTSESNKAFLFSKLFTGLGFRVKRSGLSVLGLAQPLAKKTAGKSKKKLYSFI